MSDTLVYHGSVWNHTTSPTGRAVWFWLTPEWAVTAYRDTPTGGLSLLRIPQPATPPAGEVGG